MLLGDLAPPKKAQPPNFRPMSVVAKWLDGSRCHLVGRWASVQATLCQMGIQLPTKGAQPPIFGLCLLWPNGWMDQDATGYGGRLRPRPHYVRWGPSSFLFPPRKGHSSPLFSAHVYCVQTAGWIKVPLCTDVGLGPGHVVLDRDPSPQKGAQ